MSISLPPHAHGGGYERLHQPRLRERNNGLTVDIISDALTAEVLESLGIGLEAHMDLVNPASDKMDEGLHSLGFKTKDEIVGQKTLQFDISQFMTMLYAVAPGNTDFKLTATDASGQNIKSIMLYVPQQ